MRNLTKSLVSGIWFLSPEAGGTLRRQLGPLLGEPGRAVHSTSPVVQGSTGPQGSLGNPRKTYILIYLLGFLGYCLDFGLNIKVFGKNNAIFELLRQK